MPYINADPILAKRLEEVGCATVMPLASPIGTGQGVKTLENIKIIIEQANIPVVVDAGLGVPSEASLVMEQGADFLSVNTAIAMAQNPEKWLQLLNQELRPEDWHTKRENPWLRLMLPLAGIVGK